MPSGVRSPCRPMPRGLSTGIVHLVVSAFHCPHQTGFLAGGHHCGRNGAAPSLLLCWTGIGNGQRVAIGASSTYVAGRWSVRLTYWAGRACGAGANVALHMLYPMLFTENPPALLAGVEH